MKAALLIVSFALALSLLQNVILERQLQVERGLVDAIFRVTDDIFEAAETADEPEEEWFDEDHDGIFAPREPWARDEDGMDKSA